MSELAEIKARAAERRTKGPTGMCSCSNKFAPAQNKCDICAPLSTESCCRCHEWLAEVEMLNQAEAADLDRSIAIAEDQNKHLDAWEQWFHRIVDKFLAAGEQRKEARDDVLKLRDELRRAGDVLQTAYSAGNELGRCGVSLSPDWPKIQDQSYEEVGEFLYPDITKGGVEFYDRLAETQHYEAFRQA